MADIEANPTTVSISDKPEVRWAVAVGIAGELASRPASSGAYHQYLERMDPEFGILAWQLAIKRNQQLIGTPEFIKLSASIRRSSRASTGATNGPAPAGG
jgi:hypothetical protein